MNRASSSFLAASWCLLAVSGAVAQPSLQLRTSFTDPNPGAGIRAGVTRDATSGNFYVVDSAAGQNVHEFDPTGSPLGRFSAAGCTPPAPNPYGVTTDPLTGSLWVLDGNETGPGLVLNVTEISRTGSCRGGFQLSPPLLRPGGISYDIRNGTLWIARAGHVDELSTSGTPAAGGFAFTSATGNRRLSGITYLPQLDHLLIIVDQEPYVHEVDRAGGSAGSFDLTSYGITDPQGIHYDLGTSTLSVFDEPSATVFVFDLSVCPGTVTGFGQGCADPTGVPLSLDASGCPAVGRTLRLTLQTGTTNTLPGWIALGLSSSALPSGVPLPFDLGPLGAPGCFLYTSHQVQAGPLPNQGGSATLRLRVPNLPSLPGTDLHWQGYQFAPAIPTPLPVVTSNGVTTRIG